MCFEDASTSLPLNANTTHALSLSEIKIINEKKKTEDKEKVMKQ